MEFLLDLRKTTKDDNNNLISGELILKTRLICIFNFSKETQQITYPAKKVFTEKELISFTKQQEMMVGNSIKDLIYYIWKIKNWKKSIPKHLRHNYKRFFFGKCLQTDSSIETNFLFASRNDKNNETINVFLNNKIKEFNLSNVKYFEVRTPEELEKYHTFNL